MDKHPIAAGPGVDNLVDLLRLRAAEDPAAVVCTALDGSGTEVESIDYGTLDAGARRIASVLTLRGVVTGDRVVLLLEPGCAFLTAFFGCLYAGAVAVPVPFPVPGTTVAAHVARLAPIIDNADPALTLTSRRIAAERPCAPPGGEWVAVDDPHDMPDMWVNPGDRTLALLQYTSGSTSTPKGVMITDANLLANLRAIAAAVVGCEDRHDPVTIVSWLPHFHDMGLMTLLFAVFTGGRIIVLKPITFMAAPLEWLRAIDRYGALVSAAPNFAYDHCLDRLTAEQIASLDLRSWRVAINAAEPVRATTLARFTEVFRTAGFDGGAFHPFFGMAECTVYVSGRRGPGDPLYTTVDAAALARGEVSVADDAHDTRQVVACGRIPENLDVRVVDPDTGTPAHPHETGEIWVAGDSVAAGYWRAPEATAHRFGGLLDGRTYLRTGDLGFLRHDHIHALGRLDDLIIVDGRNHHPQDLELTAGSAHGALNRNLCAAVPYEHEGERRVGILVETRRGHHPAGPTRPLDRPRTFDPEELRRAVRGAVADEHQLSVETVLLLKPGRIPRTTSGKIRRRGCIALLADSEGLTW